MIQQSRHCSRWPLPAVRLALLALYLLALPSVAALPPGAPEELKALAPEVVTVEITGVETGRAERGRYPVLYRARVLDVTRTAEGLRPGDRIAIDTFSVRPGETRLGPKPPPRLSPGWRGRVWLKPAPPTAADPGGRRFLPAAYGHGFEAADQQGEPLSPDATGSPDPLD